MTTIKQNIWCLKLWNINRLHNWIDTQEKLTRPRFPHNTCVVTVIKWSRVLYDRYEVIGMGSVRLWWLFNHGDRLVAVNCHTVLDKIGGSDLSESDEVNNKEIWGFNQWYLSRSVLIDAANTTISLIWSFQTARNKQQYMQYILMRWKTAKR